VIDAKNDLRYSVLKVDKGDLNVDDLIMEFPSLSFNLSFIPFCVSLHEMILVCDSVE
jgi:hypothetical protein